eukprot:TRINITY_DN3395_c1_g1_i1.p1 TRINITY_DN3395_c1_g1~~TRINITY_DN3395_c1_g1_i1.p1  ORF type:complete len:357 (+),score=67.95 TRINITY_DN3395_c1_g1_i1:71-1072(+)
MSTETTRWWQHVVTVLGYKEAISDIDEGTLRECVRMFCGQESIDQCVSTAKVLRNVLSSVKLFTTKSPNDRLSEPLEATLEKWNSYIEESLCDATNTFLNNIAPRQVLRRIVTMFLQPFHLSHLQRAALIEIITRRYSYTEEPSFKQLPAGLSGNPLLKFADHKLWCEFADFLAKNDLVVAEIDHEELELILNSYMIEGGKTLSGLQLSYASTLLRFTSDGVDEDIAPFSVSSMLGDDEAISCGCQFIKSVSPPWLSDAKVHDDMPSLFNETIAPFSLTLADCRIPQLQKLANSNQLAMSINSWDDQNGYAYAMFEVWFPKIESKMTIQLVDA